MKKQPLKTNQMILSALFTALISIGAFIKIPIPVVPFTLQFLFTMLAGLLLGGRLGTLSVLVYILLGLVGLPVFTEGGGLAYLLKPTFGYIIGLWPLFLYCFILAVPGDIALCILGSILGKKLIPFLHKQISYQ